MENGLKQTEDMETGLRQPEDMATRRATLEHYFGMVFSSRRPWRSLNQLPPFRFSESPNKLLPSRGTRGHFKAGRLVAASFDCQLGETPGT